VLQGYVATVFQREAYVSEVLPEGTEDVALLAAAVEPRHALEPAGVVALRLFGSNTDPAPKLLLDDLAVYVLRFFDQAASFTLDTEEIDAGQTLYGLSVASVAQLGGRFAPPAETVELQGNRFLQGVATGVFQSPSRLA
jgi:hypothetical protein